MKKFWIASIFIIVAALACTQSLIVISGSKTATSAGLAHVGSPSMCGGQTVASEATTCTLAQTVTPGDFLFCITYGLPGSTTISATANPGSVAMTQVFNTSPHDTLASWYVPNSGNFTSVTLTWSGSNGSLSSTDCEEYSGLSPTAAVVNTALVTDTGYIVATSWSSSSYTATTGNLVLSGSNYTTTGGIWGAAGAWTLRGNFSANQVSMMVEDQLSPSAGSYIGTGTNAVGGYGYWTSWIVSFK